MIPKTIHYCWFGNNKLPKKAVKCIDSWKKMCPDYEIVCWNEGNFDVHQNPYLSFMYDEKKYAFFSDYARLKIIEENGGIYLDTDVELVKPLDDLIELDAYYGFETTDYINTGLGFGAIPHHISVQALLKEYEPLIDHPDIVGCPILNTQALKCLGLVCNGIQQDIKGARIFPIDYFNPFDDSTGKLNITKNTISIHWFSKSWATKSSVLRGNMTRPLHRLLGSDFFRKGKK